VFITVCGFVMQRGALVAMFDSRTIAEQKNENEEGKNIKTNKNSKNNY